jgi:hypothetical protein
MEDFSMENVLEDEKLLSLRKPTSLAALVRRSRRAHAIDAYEARRNSKVEKVEKKRRMLNRKKEEAEKLIEQIDVILNSVQERIDVVANGGDKDPESCETAGVKKKRKVEEEVE